MHALIDAPTVELTATGVEICRRRETAISAFVSAHTAVSLWEPFSLHVDNAAIHLFDLDTGDALAA